MKRLFLFFILIIPSILFSQENMKKSAEDFVTGFLNSLEENKWDLVTEMIAEDAQMISPNGNIMPFQETVKSYLDKYKTEIKSLKIDWNKNWMFTDLTGPNSAMVTTNYIQTLNWAGNIHLKEILDVFLLERKDNVWRIKQLVSNQDLPLIYNKGIDKKYQTDKLTGIIKTEESIEISWTLISISLGYFKKAGTSPANYGKMIGERFARLWNKSKGFDKLTESFIMVLQIMSPYVEVLERNETIFKARFLAPDIHRSWGIIKEDLFISSQNCCFVFADSLGGVCSLDQDDKYWIMTLAKKSE